jgi:hypothetical protein
VFQSRLLLNKIPLRVEASGGEARGRTVLDFHDYWAVLVVEGPQAPLPHSTFRCQAWYRRAGWESLLEYPVVWDSHEASSTMYPLIW